MRAVNMQLDDFFSSYMPSLSSSLRENRLERMTLLLERIGNPERKLRTIHVAGSKGKGTTATALSFLLSSTGHRTGLFLSPHVYDIRERFTLSSSFFSEGEYLSALDELKTLISGFTLPERLGAPLPTTFELYTAYSYLLFVRTGCEWAVIETGMGGRLDATNTLLPEASVITKIELEHTQILGDTLEKIAAEKAGIIKRGKSVFVLNQKEEVIDVFRRKAESLSSPLRIFTMPGLEIRNGTFTYLGCSVKTDFPEDDIRTLDTVYALYILSSLGFDTEGKSFDFTTPSFRLPGRHETRTVKGHRMILDGAHTPESIRLLTKSLENEALPKSTLIFSCAHDKDHRTMAGEIVPLFERVIVTSTGKWKKSDPEKIYEDIHMMFPEKEIMLIPAHDDVMRTALEETPLSSVIVAAGSFYLLSELDMAIKDGNYGD